MKENQLFCLADYDIPQNKIATAAVQHVFDLADAQGGTAVFPRGIYITGTIDIKGASIYLEKGAVWKGSPDIADYRDNGFHHNEMGQTTSLLYSMHHGHISIYGEGTIDLSAEAFYTKDEPFDKRMLTLGLTQEELLECPRDYKVRPTQPIFFYDCTDIVLEGIHITGAPCWTLSFNACRDIHIEGITVRNQPNIPNNDGMHFCGSSNVIIHGCNISAGDDCIALSSITDWNRPCENFVISDCVLTCTSKTIVLGYTHSIIRNVTVSNCVIHDSQRGFCIMSSPKTGLIEHVVVSNLRIDTHVRPGNWWGNGEAIAIFNATYDTSKMGPVDDRHYDVNIRDIHFQNICCTSENAIAVIEGEGSIANVTFDGISFEKKDRTEPGFLGPRRIDVSPSDAVYELPDDDYWLYVSGGKDIRFTNVYTAPFHGRNLKKYMK